MKTNKTIYINGIKASKKAFQMLLSDIKNDTAKKIVINYTTNGNLAITTLF